MQSPGGKDEDPDGSFEYGGWVIPHFDEYLGEHMVKSVRRAGALVLGRKTYDIFSGSWPFAPDSDPIAVVYNTIPKYVASRSHLSPEWANTHQLASDIAAEVAKLKEEDGGEIQVSGSGDLVQTLLRHDLVDVFHLIVFPTVLGAGKRLFGDGAIPRGLKLVSAESTATGVAIQVYERIGDAQTGDFGPEFQDKYR